MNKCTRIITVFIVSALFASVFGFNYAQAAPSVTTGTAVLSSQYLVNVYGTVNPNGSSTEIWVEYGTSSPPSTPYGKYSIGSGSSTVDVKIWIPRLQENTTYYYRIVAQSGGAVTYGSTNSFNTANGAVTSSGGSSTSSSNSGSTSGGSNTSSGTYNSGSTAPSVITNGPASVSSNSVVLNGSINPNNTNTSFWFEFGSSQSLGQKTSIQSLNSTNSWQLVTGNISGLVPSTPYYYRVVAQNNFGTNFGDIKNFTTSANQSSTTTQSSSGGQVLGSVTGSNSGSSSTTSTSGGSVSSVGSSATVSQTTKVLAKQTNPRPSFISLEYSLADNGALVHVVDDVKPGPGDEFTYTVVYKNDTTYSFNDSKLKVIVPSEAYYASSNIEPLQISGNIVEFDLKNIKPESRGEVVIISKIREGIAPDSNLIFTSVLTYKDRLGVQLATTSYLTVKTGRDGTSLSASFLGTIFSSSSILVLIAVGLVVLMSILTYFLVKAKRKNGNNGKKEDDEFGLGSIPATFEPVGPINQVRR